MRIFVTALLFAGCITKTEISPITIETKTLYVEDELYSFIVINNTNDTLYFYTGMEGIVDTAWRSHLTDSSWREFLIDVKHPGTRMARILTLAPKEKSHQSFEVAKVLEGYLSRFLEYRLRVNYGKKIDSVHQISHSTSFTVQKKE